MLINPVLGMFAPSSKNQNRNGQTATFGSLRSRSSAGVLANEYMEFLFDVQWRNRSEGLLGGRDAGVYNPGIIIDDDPTGRPVSVEDRLLNPFSFSSFRNFFIMYCSFVDGLDRGLRLPVIYLLKTKYLLSQAVAFTAYGISLSPWLAKPFLAVVTDTVPVMGLKRKPYIVGSAWVNGLSLAGFGALTTTGIGGYILPMSLMTLRTFCRGVTTSVAQAMLLEDCSDRDQSTTSGIISQYHTAHRFGQFMSVAVSGILLSTNSFLSVFLGCAVFHAGSILLATLLEEAPAPASSSSSDEISQKIDQLRRVVNEEPGYYSLLEYAFWTMACPNYEARMAYYLLDDRHMSVFQLSLVSTAQTVASLTTPSIYYHFCADRPLRPLLKTFTIASVPAALLPLFLTTGASDALHLNPVVVASFSGFMLTMMNDLQMIPANVLVTRYAKKGLEGTIFSVFTVTEGVGRVVSEFYVGIVPVALGAAAWNNYQNMSLYIGLSGLFQLSPLPSVENMPEGEPEDKDAVPLLTED
jgi:hypothetical protein